MVSALFPTQSFFGLLCVSQSAATSAGGLGILFVSGIPAMYQYVIFLLVSKILLTRFIDLVFSARFPKTT